MNFYPGFCKSISNFKRFFLISMLLMFSVFITPHELLAATIFVHPPNATFPWHSGSGTSASPYRNLQVAIDNANSGDTIQLSAGTHELSPSGPIGYIDPTCGNCQIGVPIANTDTHGVSTDWGGFNGPLGYPSVQTTRGFRINGKNLNLIGASIGSTIVNVGNAEYGIVFENASGSSSISQMTIKGGSGLNVALARGYFDLQFPIVPGATTGDPDGPAAQLPLISQRAFDEYVQTLMKTNGHLIVRKANVTVQHILIKGEADDGENCSGPGNPVATCLEYDDPFTSNVETTAYNFCHPTDCPFTRGIVVREGGNVTIENTTILDTNYDSIQLTQSNPNISGDAARASIYDSTLGGTFNAGACQFINTAGAIASLHDSTFNAVRNTVQCTTKGVEVFGGREPGRLDEDIPLRRLFNNIIKGQTVYGAAAGPNEMTLVFVNNVFTENAKTFHSDFFNPNVSVYMSNNAFMDTYFDGDGDTQTPHVTSSSRFDYNAFIGVPHHYYADANQTIDGNIYVPTIQEAFGNLSTFQLKCDSPLVGTGNYSYQNGGVAGARSDIGVNGGTYPKFGIFDTGACNYPYGIIRWDTIPQSFSGQRELNKLFDGITSWPNTAIINHTPGDVTIEIEFETPRVMTSFEAAVAGSSGGNADYLWTIQADATGASGFTTLTNNYRTTIQGIVTIPVLNSSVAGKVWRITVNRDNGDSVEHILELKPLSTFYNYAPEIINGNQAPLIINEGQAYYFDVNAVDDDNDVLTYQLISGPTSLGEGGMTINSATGEINWVAPQVSINQTYNVAVNVSDGNGASDTFAWSITVQNQSAYPYNIIRVDTIPSAPSYFTERNLQELFDGVIGWPNTAVIYTAFSQMLIIEIEFEYIHELDSFTAAVAGITGGNASYRWRVQRANSAGGTFTYVQPAFQTTTQGLVTIPFPKSSGKVWRVTVFRDNGNVPGGANAWEHVLELTPQFTN